MIGFCAAQVGHQDARMSSTTGSPAAVSWSNRAGLYGAIVPASAGAAGSQAPTDSSMAVMTRFMSDVLSMTPAAADHRRCEPSQRWWSAHGHERTLSSRGRQFVARRPAFLIILFIFLYLLLQFLFRSHFGPHNYLRKISHF